MKDDPFDIEKFKLPPMAERPVSTPAKVRKRREHFIKVPVAWDDKLTGCAGTTYKIANRILYLHWRNRGRPFKLANGMLEYDGVSRFSKRRALANLEWLGLVTVERQFKKSPIVHVHLEPK